MPPAPHVLVVDDDPDLAEVACEIMTMAGTPAIYRTSVTDAIEAMTRYAGSLGALLTDINLASPMSGIELAIYVAEEWPDVTIGVMSGVFVERPKRLPDKATFLLKPCRPPDLVAFARGLGGIKAAAAP